MAPITGLVVVKRFTYRTNTNERYNNEYFLSGAPPSSPGDWRTLLDALALQEKACYDPSVSIVAAYGYDDDAEDAQSVWSVDLTASPNTPVVGTLVTTGGARAPGDAAVWVRWGLNALNTRGKRIYCRKYFHPAWIGSATAGDAILNGQQVALNALGLKLRDGTFLDGRVIRSRVHSEVPINHAASTYVTTRTLKRRGKRSP